MKRKHLTATHAGQTFTRTTHRDYTHVVVGKRNPVAEAPYRTAEWIASDRMAGAYDRFNAFGWCSRLDLAQKLAATETRNGRLEVTIVQVQPA